MIALIGWLFIVGGVEIEWASEVKVKDADANIQECSDAKVREATLEAGEAKVSAASAQASAMRAGAEVCKQDEITKYLRVQAEYIGNKPDRPLRFPRLESLNALDDFPPAKATVEYIENDSEALAFARIIIHGLRSVGGPFLMRRLIGPNAMKPLSSEAAIQNFPLQESWYSPNERLLSPLPASHTRTR